MIDFAEFYDRLRDRLLALAAESQGVLTIEAERRYHTDAKFHAQVDLICLAAVQVLQTMGENRPEVPVEYTEAFKKEVSDLLGWTDD